MMTAAPYVQVNIGGQLRGLKFDNEAFELYHQYTDWDRITNSSQVYAYVYGGLVSNCHKKRIDEDFTFEQVCEWVDQLNESEDGKVELEKVAAAFTQCTNWKKLIEGIEEKVRQLEADSKPAKKKAVRRKQ